MASTSVCRNQLWEDAIGVVPEYGRKIALRNFGRQQLCERPLCRHDLAIRAEQDSPWARRLDEPSKLCLPAQRVARGKVEEDIRQLQETLRPSPVGVGRDEGHVWMTLGYRVKPGHVRQDRQLPPSSGS